MDIVNAVKSSALNVAEFFTPVLKVNFPKFCQTGKKRKRHPVIKLIRLFDITFFAGIQIQRNRRSNAGRSPFNFFYPLNLLNRKNSLNFFSSLLLAIT